MVLVIDPALVQHKVETGLCHAAKEVGFCEPDREDRFCIAIFPFLEVRRH